MTFDHSSDAASGWFFFRNGGIEYLGFSKNYYLTQQQLSMVSLADYRQTLAGVPPRSHQ